MLPQSFLLTSAPFFLLHSFPLPLRHCAFSRLQSKFNNEKCVIQIFISFFESESFARKSFNSSLCTKCSNVKWFHQHWQFQAAFLQKVAVMLSQGRVKLLRNPGGFEKAFISPKWCPVENNVPHDRLCP